MTYGREKTQCQSGLPIHMGEEKYYLIQPTLAILAHLRGQEKTEKLMKITVQTKLIKRMRANHRTTELCPSPTSYNQITKDLFIAVSFTQYIMSGYQEKITGHTKEQKTE